MKGLELVVGDCHFGDDQKVAALGDPFLPVSNPGDELIPWGAGDEPCLVNRAILWSEGNCVRTKITSICGVALGTSDDDLLKASEKASGNPSLRYVLDSGLGCLHIVTDLALLERHLAVLEKVCLEHILERGIGAFEGRRAGSLPADDRPHENFRPGQLAKLGLGEAALKAARPDLVIARISGYGQDGPGRDRAAFGVIGEAIGGIRYLTNHAPGVTDLPPVRVGVSLGLALCPADGKTASELVQAADHRMYASKSERKRMRQGRAVS